MYLLYITSLHNSDKHSLCYSPGLTFIKNLNVVSLVDYHFFKMNSLTENYEENSVFTAFRKASIQIFKVLNDADVQMCYFAPECHNI